MHVCAPWKGHACVRIVHRTAVCLRYDVSCLHACGSSVKEPGGRPAVAKSVKKSREKFDVEPHQTHQKVVKRKPTGHDCLLRFEDFMK